MTVDLGDADKAALIALLFLRIGFGLSSGQSA